MIVKLRPFSCLNQTMEARAEAAISSAIQAGEDYVGVCKLWD